MTQQLQVGGVDLSDALDGFENQAPSGGGAFIQPGSYLLRCKSVEFKKGFKGLSFIGTNEVVKVIREEENSNPEQGDANVVENISKNKAIAHGNMKAYLLALCESKFQKKINHKDVKAEFVVKCCEPSQPLKGLYVFCDAINKPRDGKTPITIKNWRLATNEELAPLGLKQPG